MATKTYALELNDAGLVLARALADGQVEVLADSPGFALSEQGRVLTGAQAYARARLRPRFAHNRYFMDLSTQPLARPDEQAQTTADLAYIHLSTLLQPLVERDGELLLAVPAAFSREQLGLLLGILSECGLTVAGVVDSGLAAVAEAEAAPRTAHLELQLHRSLLTLLEHDRRDSVVRVQYDINPRVGLVSLQQTALQHIADVFVRKTRFDPLYEAQNEQLLVDRLPGLLESLHAQEITECTMEARSGTYSVELTQAGLLAALSGAYQELVQLVQGALRAHEILQLAISHRVSAWPGLVERLSNIPAIEARVLAHAAPATGALRHLAAVRRGPESLALVTRLPAALAAESAAVALAPLQVPREQQPTHVLFNSRAIAITPQPLTIGWAVNGAARALLVPSGVPGVSRAHCTLVRREGAVIVEDHSTYGSFINDARVQGSGVLKVGDRLRLGAPGIALDLIQLVHDDGSPAPAL
ncbi:MAG: FHA domain-containing protein [Steroidobacteraceae bacterium]